MKEAAMKDLHVTYNSQCLRMVIYNTALEKESLDGQQLNSQRVSNYLSL